VNGFPEKVLLATDGSENTTLASRRRSISRREAGQSCTWYTSGILFLPLASRA